MKAYLVEVRIRPWEEGGYIAEVAALQGCWCLLKPRQTLAKALSDIQEVVEMSIQARKKRGQLILLEASPAQKATFLRQLAVPAS